MKTDASPKNWQVITPSTYPWEKEALQYIQSHFPTHEPYRAWSNFEFIADDGSLNEVDLLVFTPQGFFLVEIKSNPGVLSGDASTWIWQHDDRKKVVDNPLFLANLKSKKLASLLKRQRALDKLRLPFIETLIFCSAEDLQCRLEGNAQFRICLRDHEKHPGIMAALKSRKCLGLPGQPRGIHDRPMAKAISRGLDQIGIRPTQRGRRVGDYELQNLIDEGPGYQDFLAQHVAIKDTLRRIRIYLVQNEVDPGQRKVLHRAAEREFRLLQTLEHPGVLRAIDFTTHDLGPSIIFQHTPSAIRLDHYLIKNKDKISDDIRLDLVRQISETIRFAHKKHIVHRALSPRAILLNNQDSSYPQAVIMNWQLGYRQSFKGGTVLTKEVTATRHLDNLTDQQIQVFMAPETLSDLDTFGEHHDIFSLGAICYQLFTSQAPAESSMALAEKLRTHRGLRVSAVLNGAPESLDQLVQYSTNPDVSERIDSVEEFIEFLDQVEDELTTPTNQLVGDPNHAKPGDILQGGFHVIRKLGVGSTATAFLVEKNQREFVIKVAVDVEHNDRVRDEGQVLKKLNSPLFVRCHEIIQINDRTAILLDRAGESTLRQRIRNEGRLSFDLLQRFGEDLLEAVVLLEREGIAHRDIKPENIGVSAVGRGDALHLVLFDFSLSRFSPENIRAGTPGYLDPFLSLRKPPRWDLQAERFSTAVTLFHMATGFLPVWHDGKTDPAMVECEATIDPELFEPNLREQLTHFFQKALRRNPRERFDNAQQMLDAWHRVFSTVAGTLSTTDEGIEQDNSALLASATMETSIAELGLGPAAVDALDRINVVKVEDLLGLWGKRLSHMRGVGNQTRKRILAAVKVLRKQLGKSSNGDITRFTTDDIYTEEGTVPHDRLSIDILVDQILRAKAKSRNVTENTALEALLGLDKRIDHIWPSQTDVAPLAGVTRARISQIMSQAISRWVRNPAITALRNQMADILEQNGGVTSAQEMCQALLAARGCVAEEPMRTRLGRVVTRAAVETESLLDEPKFVIRRTGANILIAIDMSLADYAVTLGQKADKIAKEDPLMPPGRALEMLREAPLPPEAEPLSDARLIRLATAASQSAAISSRQEIYPKGMNAGRALRLSQGSLVGVRFLKPNQIRQRVTSRYPMAAPLPGHPKLDKLLSDVGLELTWNADHPGGGAYVSTARNVLSVTDGTRTPSRYSTTLRSTGSPATLFAPNYVDPDVAEARQFEERLRFAEKQGSFLALTVNPSLYSRARHELAERFKVQPLDLEHVFLKHLRQSAEQVKADWKVVVAADAAPPQSADWRNLNRLIDSKVIPHVEQAIFEAKTTVLAFHLNWLHRYGQVVMLTRVQQAVQDGRLHGAWLLIPASPQTPMPLLDGEAVPVITNNQWAHIPEGWCQNMHRAGTKNNSG